MSGISTIQSTIAADLDAYESAMWLTSSYLISMSSVSPLIGRLAMQFSPQVMILFSSAWFSIGAVVTSQARSFAVFVFGRVLVGIGGGGVMTLSLILVIQLTSKRTRGLMIGLTNAVGVLLMFRWWVDVDLLFRGSPLALRWELWCLGRCSRSLDGYVVAPLERLYPNLQRTDLI